MGEGLPPSYQSSEARNNGDAMNLSAIKQKIDDLEAIMWKNSQEIQ